MATTIFPSIGDNTQTVLGLPYVAGSGTMTLATGTGAALQAALTRAGFPTISSSAPVLFAVATAQSFNTYGGLIPSPTYATYTATGLSGDVLTGVAVSGGYTDQSFAAGSTVECDVTAAQFYAIQTAINNIESGGNLPATVVLTTGSYANPAWITSLSGSKITTGTVPLGSGGTGANLSATGGANQFVKQTSLGGALTVAVISTADLPGSVVLTSGSYSNPAWITSILGSIVSGNITGNAASITGSIAESQVTNLVSDLALKAPLASPALTGTPTSTTPSTADNSTKIATTAYVQAQGYLTTNAVTTVFGRSGAVTATSGDYSVGQITGAAPLASPTFAGVVTTATLNAPVTYGGFTTDIDGATITFDMSVSDRHKVTLGGNRTLAVANTTTGQIFQVVLIQDGSGSRTVTWWSGIKWAGTASTSTPPTLSTGAGLRDVLNFEQLGTGDYVGVLAFQGV